MITGTQTGGRVGPTPISSHSCDGDVAVRIMPRTISLAVCALLLTISGGSSWIRPLTGVLIVTLDTHAGRPVAVLRLYRRRHARAQSPVARRSGVRAGGLGRAAHLTGSLQPLHRPPSAAPSRPRQPRPPARRGLAHAGGGVARERVQNCRVRWIGGTRPGSRARPGIRRVRRRAASSDRRATAAIRAAVVDDAVRWLEHRDEQPFLAWVHL